MKRCPVCDGELNRVGTCTACNLNRNLKHIGELVLDVLEAAKERANDELKRLEKELGQ